MTDYLRNLFMINGLAFGNLAAVYYYAYIPMQLPAGILMDRTSPRKLLIFACLACGIGTYWFAQPNLTIAYLGRFLVGLGSAFAFVGVMKLATLWFPASYFSFLTGLTTSLGMVGAMMGNITLAHLMDLIGSHQLLKSAVIAGFILTVAMGIIIPEQSPQLTHKPIPTLRQSTYITQLFALLKDRQMWLLGIIGCCLFLSLTTFAEMWGIPYLICHYDLPTYKAASYNSLVFLGWAIGGPLMGSIASQFKKKDYRPLFIMLNALLGALCFSIMLYFPQWAKPYLGILLFGFGVFSAVQVIIFSIVRDFYNPSLSGIAFAVTNLLVMLGGGISQPLVGYLLDLFSLPSNSTHLLTFSNQGFIYAMSALPCAFVLAAFLSLFIQKPTHDIHIAKPAQ
jgi:MFS family permease